MGYLRKLLFWVAQFRMSAILDRKPESSRYCCEGAKPTLMKLSHNFLLYLTAFPKRTCDAGPQTNVSRTSAILDRKHLLLEGEGKKANSKHNQNHNRYQPLLGGMEEEEPNHNWNQNQHHHLRLEGGAKKVNRNHNQNQHHNHNQYQPFLKGGRKKRNQTTTRTRTNTKASFLKAKGRRRTSTTTTTTTMVLVLVVV